MEKFLKSEAVATIGSFILFIACLLAFIGANAYLAYDKHFLFLAANIIVDVLAVPTVIKVVKHMTGGDSDNTEK